MGGLLPMKTESLGLSSVVMDSREDAGEAENVHAAEPSTEFELLRSDGVGHNTTEATFFGGLDAAVATPGTGAPATPSWLFSDAQALLGNTGTQTPALASSRTMVEDCQSQGPPGAVAPVPVTEKAAGVVENRETAAAGTAAERDRSR